MTALILGLLLQVPVLQEHPCAFLEAKADAIIIPCEMDQLRLSNHNLTVERDSLKAQIADLQKQLANLATMVDQNAATAAIDEMYRMYRIERKDYDVKWIDGTWKFVKR